MAIYRNRDSEVRPLDSLGISEPEERVYRWLLAHSGASASEVAQALAFASAKAQRLLGAIETKGLVTHSPERPRRYLPSSPDVALEALIVQRQKRLRDARLVARELQAEVSFKRHDERAQNVEVITSREAQHQVFEKMSQFARREVLSFLKLPLIVTRLDMPPEQERPAQREAQARGVNYRTIVDNEFMDMPGAVRSVQADMEAGEEVRVASHLPIKLVLTDRSLALMPLDPEVPDSPILLVRSSAVLGALYELFEMVWERSVPFSEDEQSGVSKLGLGEETTDLISLMAAGLNDKTIAYDLNISKRTIERRIAEMMRALGVRTRFQLGWVLRLLPDKDKTRSE